MTRPSLDFWFSIGSTYSYLTVMRIDDVAAAAGIDVRWRPFSVRQLMQEMSNVPFVGKPAKERYMWRDLERRANGYGIPIRLPVEYPLAEFDRANRIAVLAASEGWCESYVKATYQHWFQDGLPAGGDSNLRASLTDIGQDFKSVRVRSDSDAVSTLYKEATDAARNAGLFGSPSFVTADGELFWGDDRLEDAVAFATR